MIVRILLVCSAAFAWAFAPAASAQKAVAPFDPGSRYICPNNQDSGLDCYLDAVTHLYTMCRHVKSIEIIEFGMDKAQEGVNGAKSEYCVDKQKVNITRPYQAALREATGWREVVESLRTLQQLWLESMVSLRYQAGEDADSYEERVNRIYDELSFKIESVRVGFTTAPDGAPAVATARPPRAEAKSKAKAKAPQ
jgi:hypothetical protein